MPTGENKALARRFFYEMLNDGKTEIAEDICAPDFLFSVPTHSEVFRGVEGCRSLVGMVRGCFPDIHFAVEDMAAEGDRVLTRWTARGTHTGAPFPTVVGVVPAAGNAFLVEGMTWHRIIDGRIAEVTANEDSLGLIRQLGRAVLTHLPAPAAPEPTAPEAARILVRRYFDEVMNQGKLEVIDEIAAPHFAFRIPTLPDPIRGPEGLRRFVTGLRTSFPDIRFSAEYAVVDGNKAGVRYSMRGTHLGAFYGVPATGKVVEDGGNDLFHFAGGKIATIWVSQDAVGLLRQLGVVAVGA